MLTNQTQKVQIENGLLRKDITLHLKIQFLNYQYHPYPLLKNKRQIFAVPNRSHRRTC